MASSDTPRSPLELWRQLVPQGHDTALRNAFYNVAAAVFIGGAVAAAWSVYLILQPFVQALMWAVLCGSVLHPIKYKVATSVRKWLLQVDETKSLLSISFVFMPVTCLDNLSEFIGWYVMNHMRAVTAVTVLLPMVYIIIHYTPSALSHFAFALLSFLFYGIRFCLNLIGQYNYIFMTGILMYFIKVIFFLTPENEHLYRRLSMPVWLLLSALVSCWWPSANVFLFLICILLMCGGIFAQMVDLRNNSVIYSNKAKDWFCALQICLGWHEDSYNSKEDADETSPMKLEDVKPNPDEGEIETEEKEFSSETIESISPLPEEDLSPQKESSSAESRSPSQISSAQKEIISRPVNLSAFGTKENRKNRREKKAKSDESSSNMYLKTVFVACVLVELWRHSYLLSLLPLTIGYYIIKKFTSYHIFGDGFIKENLAKFHGKLVSLTPWYESRKHVLFTPPLLGIMKMLKKTDRRIVKILVVSVDGVVTTLIMLACLLFLVVASVFLAVQIQGEGMHMIKMGSQVINATIVNNPQLHEMLPEGINKVIGSALDNGYLYGREVIGSIIRSMVGDGNEEKVAELEQQVIELWDHIYQAWVVEHPQPPFKGPVVTSEAVGVTFDSLVEGIMKSPELISFSKLSAVLKDNLGTVMNVAEGIWTILISNLNLFLSAFTTLFSLLLGGSLSILNAILNLIVFLSSLFYILSISNEVYKPVAILSSLSPGQMNSLGSAVEESVNGVFKASFKMGLFYGMWTWLLHSIFATNIVYIPSVLGALFGAVPLVGTYWAAVPGALELAWGCESPFLGLLLIVAQLLPLSCVDTAFYAEIKGGGHPYLTGLAVAGGIFCWGVEGAILGPLVLCILLVVTKMYTSLIQSPTDFLQKYRKFRRSQSEFEF